jgi:hypothetical protein
MKKILLGLVAGLTLLAFTVPARAEGEAAGGDKAAETPKKGKKGKKKKGDEAPAGEAGAAPAGGDTKK